MRRPGSRKPLFPRAMIGWQWGVSPKNYRILITCHLAFRGRFDRGNIAICQAWVFFFLHGGPMSNGVVKFLLTQSDSHSQDPPSWELFWWQKQATISPPCQLQGLHFELEKRHSVCLLPIERDAHNAQLIQHLGCDVYLYRSHLKAICSKSKEQHLVSLSLIQKD